MKSTAEFKSNKFTAFSLLASISALVMVIADYLLEYMGQPSFSVGSTGFIQSGWLTVPMWRFPLTIALCGFAIPFYLLGFYVLYKEIKLTSPKAAAAYFAMTGFGIMTASLIHGLLAYMPMAYKQLSGAGQDALAVSVAESIYRASAPVFWFHYAITWIIPQVLLLVMIARKKTIFSRIGLLLNPFTFLVAGMALKLISPAFFELLYVGTINRGNMALFLMAFFYARSLRDERV